MSRNLDTDKFANGDQIPQARSLDEFINTTSPSWMIYNNNPKIQGIGGRLYNFYAVKDSRGLCPSGWHVPSENDWIELKSFIGGNGGALKSAGSIRESTGFWFKGEWIELKPGQINYAGDKKAQILWWEPNTNASNSTKFSAEPVGRIRGVPFGGPVFTGFNILAQFWTSNYTKSTFGESTTLANSFLLSYNDDILRATNEFLYAGLSVRCMKDNESTIKISTPKNIKIEEKNTGQAIPVNEVSSNQTSQMGQLEIFNTIEADNNADAFGFAIFVDDKRVQDKILYYPSKYDIGKIIIPLNEGKHQIYLSEIHKNYFTKGRRTARFNNVEIKKDEITKIKMTLRDTNIEEGELNK